MTSEDQDILAKISQLAGQINRHKNQQHPVQSIGASRSHSTYHTHASPVLPPPRGAYSRRGRGYPRGGRLPQVHRNKTLVLNGVTTSASAAENRSTENEANQSTNESAPPTWVTKTDRHLQLINPAIFEKQSQQRTKAMEETRQLKLKQRDERERLKFNKHLQRVGKVSSNGEIEIAHLATTSQYEISINDVRFRVAKNGSKLLKVTGDENAAKATPKITTVGGVKFYRSKNGNLYRSGIVKGQRRRGAIQKINEPCKAFSTTGSFFLSNTIPGLTICKAEGCRYIHDPSKVAICKELLQKGICPAGESCDLSHGLTPERTPACLHFAKGNCSNPNCRYTHVRVSPSAPVCRAFGIYGYCEKGIHCSDRHVNECPDFSNSGICNTKGCKLLHRYKASIIRKNTALAEQPDEDGSSDLSSDEEQDEIDSDDVDSDELEEFFGDEEGDGDSDIVMQRDFVHL